eukprot:1178016-Prorocentrum_minimum.AAC.1
MESWCECASCEVQSTLYRARRLTVSILQVIFYRIGMPVPKVDNIKGSSTGGAAWVNLQRALGPTAAKRRALALGAVKGDGERPPAEGQFRVRYIGYRSASRFATGAMCGDLPIASVDDVDC